VLGPGARGRHPSHRRCQPPTGGSRSSPGSLPRGREEQTRSPAQTAFIWVSPAKADAPFRATHSWLLGDARPLAAVIALVAAAGFVLAGIGFITQQAWWAFTGVGAGAAALRSR
jgi:hypothetical protein